MRQAGYTEVEGYKLVSVDVGLNRVVHKNVDQRLFVTNLFDKRYEFQAFPPILGFAVHSPGMPRTVDVTARVRV